MEFPFSVKRSLTFEVGKEVFSEALLEVSKVDY